MMPLIKLILKGIIMNMIKAAFLVSTLAVGAAQAATTVPCEGFKIELQNKSQNNLVIDQAHFFGGNGKTLDGLVMAPENKVVYTINDVQQGKTMRTELMLHSAQDPSKALKVSFTLKNQNMVCEMANLVTLGSLALEDQRVAGGVLLNVKDKK
jgi:hypothetical protein